jgi:hypothetical protein
MQSTARLLAIAILCISFLGCGSSSSTGAAGPAIAQPEILFVQMVGPEELNWPRGPIEVQYGLRITNPGTAAITLRQIELSPSGSDSGAYRVRRNRYFFREEVGAGQSKDVTFWAKADSDGARDRIDAQAPVSVRGIGYFESAAGNLRKVFVGHFSQAAR